MSVPRLFSGHTAALQILTDCVPRGALVVDAGAFPGHLTRAMHAHGYRVIALDVDPDRGLDIQTRYQTGQAEHVPGEETFASLMKSIGIDARACDLELSDYPVDTGTVDVVVITEVIEHLYVNPLRAISEVNRILKPGGRCLMSTPNLLSLRNRMNFLRGHMDRVIEAPTLAFLQKQRVGHIGHVRLYAPQELTDMLRTFGFTSTIHFRPFDFWDPVPGAAPAPTPAPAQAPTTEPPATVAAFAPRRRYLRPPMDYARAAAATLRVQIERRVPSLQSHMFVMATKTRDVRADDLTVANVKPYLSGHA